MLQINCHSVIDCSHNIMREQRLTIFARIQLTSLFFRQFFGKTRAIYFTLDSVCLTNLT